MRVIKKILKNKTTGQLIVTIPKDSDFVAGDYVELVLVPKLEGNKNEK